MGSTISNITDKINEHGSWDAYQKHLLETDFVKIKTVFELERRSFKTFPIFQDSEGNEVIDGNRIKIIHHLNYQFLNGITALVRWSSQKGMYEYKADFRNQDFTDFNGVHNFVVIH